MSPPTHLLALVFIHIMLMASYNSTPAGCPTNLRRISFWDYARGWGGVSEGGFSLLDHEWMVVMA